MKKNIAFILLLPVLLSLYGLWVFVVNVPTQLVGKTLNPDQVVAKYEWFYNVNSNFNSRVAQVKQYKKVIPTDNAEASKLRMEMYAIQQTCRELANNYQAQSEKINSGFLKGRGLPVFLDSGECE